VQHCQQYWPLWDRVYWYLKPSVDPCGYNLSV
jgi:hypothetical protein